MTVRAVRHVRATGKPVGFAVQMDAEKAHQQASELLAMASSWQMHKLHSTFMARGAIMTKCALCRALNSTVPQI